MWFSYDLAEYFLSTTFYEPVFLPQSISFAYCDWGFTFAQVSMGQVLDEKKPHVLILEDSLDSLLHSHCLYQPCRHWALFTLGSVRHLCGNSLTFCPDKRDALVWSVWLVWGSWKTSPPSAEMPFLAQ